MAENTVFLKHPHGDEIKEVEATTEVLVPLMGKGWSQVPAPPPDGESGIIRNSEESGIMASGVASTSLMSPVCG